MCDRFIKNFADIVIEKTKNPLKLYYVEIPEGVEVDLDYESCSAFVTANYTENEARNMKPEYAWVDDTKILKVTEIGYANENVTPGIIIQHNHYLLRLN
jgi:hypothetical protein